jgi:hypothetical protein
MLPTIVYGCIKILTLLTAYGGPFGTYEDKEDDRDKEGE